MVTPLKSGYMKCIYIFIYLFIFISLSIYLLAHLTPDFLLHNSYGIQLFHAC